MTNKLLVDECLTPDLVAIGLQFGYHATSVHYLSRASAPDWSILKVIENGDFLFVTNNARDFVKLYGRMAIHNGLIPILPTVGRDRQRQLFEIALRFIDTLPDLVNKCLAIDEDGRIDVSDLHA